MQKATERHTGSCREGLGCSLCVGSRKAVQAAMEPTQQSAEESDKRLQGGEINMERACHHTRGDTLNRGSGQLCKMLLESLEGQGARWPRSVTTWRLQRSGCWGHEEADNPEVRAD